MNSVQPTFHLVESATWLTPCIITCIGVYFIQLCNFMCRSLFCLHELIWRNVYDRGDRLGEPSGGRWYARTDSNACGILVAEDNVVEAFRSVAYNVFVPSQNFFLSGINSTAPP